MVIVPTLTSSGGFALAKPAFPINILDPLSVSVLSYVKK
jgi:hypothetical protein